MSQPTCPAVPDLSAARVLVAGDLMLDRYWNGPTQRISPEAPVPVVRVERCDERPGGAANVALNLAALGVRTHLAGVVGQDEAATTLERLLNGRGIGLSLHRRADVPTVTKLRIMSHHQQMLRLDFEQSLVPRGDDPLTATLADQLAASDLLLLSDYAKGTLAAVAKLIATARAAGLPVFVDPKGEDFTRYRGATLLTPNRAELERIVGTCADESQLAERGEQLRAELDLAALLITLGERGLLLIHAGAPALHLPAQAREVYDVTGAGDTVIATLAAASAAGLALADACALANTAAGLAVARLGTASISVAELRHAWHGDQTSSGGVLDEQMLLAAVAQTRERGERIVMTNGCFDILHAGHVASLQQARRLGDRLIVAVNSDDSVRRLKGAERPVNPLQQRMAVLSALGCVDWVCSFDEDTPERLICRVLPDVLAKGGDYRAEEVAGGDCVRAHGGEVRILDLLPGQSTTRMIETLRTPPA